MSEQPSDTFIGLTKSAFALVVVLIVAVGWIVGIVGAVVNQRSQHAATLRNEKALTYICSTTSVLDQLVADSTRSIRFEFTSGAYRRFVRQHILTKGDVRRARRELNKYTAAHHKLQHNGACERVRSQ